MSRSSFLIAGGVIVLFAPTFDGATAEPRPCLDVASPLFHNAQISNCQYRHPDGSICKVKGDYPFTDHIDKDCRCVHIRVIRGGGGTPPELPTPGIFSGLLSNAIRSGTCQIIA